ncbi:MAG: flavodoxin family protein [Planctomycetota bacterium]|jgi:NAD(P)H dehydrogenase (quinone)
MAKGIVVYYSRSGNTKAMAELIAKAMNKGGDAIVVGSPTYYGHMAGPVKQLFDGLVSRHGQLDGKVGGAFSSAANIGGGNETTIMGIIEAMLISGMIVQGDPMGDHYGPVSIGKPDERVIEQCRRRGTRIAELTKRLAC